MSSTLIIYSTTDGQTKAICNKIGSIIKLTRSTEIVSIDDVNNLNISVDLVSLSMEPILLQIALVCPFVVEYIIRVDDI